jgi:regulatory protein
VSPADPAEGVEPQVGTAGGSSERERALAAALRSLARRDRTVAEVRGLLERRGFAVEVAEKVIEGLREDAYLDDARYARRFAEDRRTLDGWGAERIARDLGRRGVAEGSIEAALDTLGRGNELAVARRLLSERFTGPLEDDRTRGRAWRLLVRRGFASELAYAALREHERAALEGPSAGA